MAPDAKPMTQSTTLGGNLGGSIAKENVAAAVDDYVKFHDTDGGDVEKRKSMYADMVRADEAPARARHAGEAGDARAGRARAPRYAGSIARGARGSPVDGRGERDAHRDAAAAAALSSQAAPRRTAAPRSDLGPAGDRHEHALGRCALCGVCDGRGRAHPPQRWR